MTEHHDNVMNLRKEVNPVFETAKACLKITAENGDINAQKLLEALRFGTLETDSINDLPEEVKNSMKQVILIASIMIEMRFESTEEYFRRSGLHQLMDLPCGYTSRGLRLAGKGGVKYYGCDIPAVIDEFLPAVKKFLTPEDLKFIHYSSVDATNYDSLRNALKGAEGELLITTEGMLMYFTQSELEEVFSNIHRLLEEFGGRWITLDRQLTEKDDLIHRAVSEGLNEKSIDIIRKTLSARSIDTPDNLMFSDDEPTARKFIHDMGFDLELEPLKYYLPEKLHSTESLPVENQIAVREILEGMSYYVMTPRRVTASKTNRSVSRNFTEESYIDGTTLRVKLSGRLDTISAPELLDKFRAIKSSNEIQNAELDMGELDYISSAGLRALMIMFKELPKNGFRMINIKPSVKEILETTGFDSILNVDVV